MTVSLFYCTAEFTASNTKHSNVNKCCAKSNTMLSLTQLCVCVLARPTGRRRPSLSPVPLEDQTQHSRQKQSRRSCISPLTFMQTNNKLQHHKDRKMPHRCCHSPYKVNNTDCIPQGWAMPSVQWYQLPELISINSNTLQHHA